MAAPNPIGEIVKEYLSKYAHLPSRRIAFLLAEKYPELFATEEKARSFVRYYRGALGDKNRKGMSAEAYLPRISIPVGDSETYEPLVLGEDSYPIGVGADAHIPYHDQDALEVFIERMVEIEARTVVLLGDWIDMYAVSRWIRDPRKRDLGGEIEVFREVMHALRAALPEARIIFKLGNHEERWDAYICNNAPALFHVPEMHLEKVLGLDTFGIEVLGKKRLIRAGHLHLLHGHEYVFSMQNPVNPARGLYLRAKKSALCAHFHQTSEHSETSIDGKVATCWSVGALCDLRPEYMPLNKWNHGFAEIYEDEQSFSVRNRKIINYRVV